MNLLYYLMGAVAIQGVIIAFAGDAPVLRVFYGKPIFTDVSLEAVSKAETALKAADIKYTVQTIRNRNALLQAGDVNAYRKINMAYTPERDKMSYVYNIYVRRYLKKEALRALGKDSEDI